MPWTPDTMRSIEAEAAMSPLSTNSSTFSIKYGVDSSKYRIRLSADNRDLWYESTQLHHNKEIYKYVCCNNIDV